MHARIYWKRLDADSYDSLRSCVVHLNADGKFHSYRLNLASIAQYRDLITGLAIEPEGQPRPGGQWVIKSIVLSAKGK